MDSFTLRECEQQYFLSLNIQPRLFPIEDHSHDVLDAEEGRWPRSLQEKNLYIHDFFDKTIIEADSSKVEAYRGLQLTKILGIFV